MCVCFRAFTPFRGFHIQTLIEQRCFRGVGALQCRYWMDAAFLLLLLLQDDEDDDGDDDVIAGSSLFLRREASRK